MARASLCGEALPAHTRDLLRRFFVLKAKSFIKGPTQTLVESALLVYSPAREISTGRTRRYLRNKSVFFAAIPSGPHLSDAKDARDQAARLITLACVFCERIAVARIFRLE
jgi:hypothetical protein